MSQSPDAILLELRARIGKPAACFCTGACSPQPNGLPHFPERCPAYGAQLETFEEAVERRAKLLEAFGSSDLATALRQAANLETDR